MVFNILGILMSFWYIAYRWVYLADKIKYSWAYTPINLSTAFASIPFIVVTLFTPDKSYVYWIYVLAIFLLYRNLWYTAEDAKDYLSMLHNPLKYDPSQIKEQIFFIAIDLMMVAYVGIWVVKYKGVVL